MNTKSDQMLPYHCYGLDDFRDEYEALAKVDPDGEWYKRNEVDALLSDITEKIAQAYGYLWHVNNMEYGFQFSAEQAAYKARRVLRDLLTNEQRGEAINATGKEIGAYSHEAD